MVKGVETSKPKGSIRIKSNKKELKRKREEIEIEEEEASDKDINKESNGSDSDSESDDNLSSNDLIENESSDDLNDEFSEADEFEDSDLDEDDSFDVEEEEGDGSKPTRTPTIPKHEKQKEAFAKAMSAILQSKVKAHDRENPILVRSKKTAKDIETSRLDAKARRELQADKKQLQDKDRVKNPLEIRPDDEFTTAQQVLENEKKLRKIAQKGVVRLFNAILTSQTVVNTTASESSNKVIGLTKKEEQMTEMSKDTFLDLIRSGAKE